MAGTDQGRHLAALRDRARRPDPKFRTGRDADLRAAIADQDPDDEYDDEEF